MLAGDELRYVFHRSRTIKSVHGDEVFERRGMQLPQIFLHTGGLELECTGCLSVAIQFISLGVLQTDMVDIQIMSGSQFHVLDRFLDDGQGLQTQEVHLDQSGFLDHGTLVLGNQHLLAGILVFLPY